MGRQAMHGWNGFSEGGRHAPRFSLQRVIGWIVTAAVLAAASVLAIVFAATVAVVAVLSAGLLGLYALTQRRRPQGVLIEARKVGHSWVAYGWDQRQR